MEKIAKKKNFQGLKIRIMYKILSGAKPLEKFWNYVKIKVFYYSYEGRHGPFGGSQKYECNFVHPAPIWLSPLIKSFSTFENQ